MIKNDIKQLVVLNEIRSKLEMLHSDIIPESEKHSIIDATQNVASNVRSVSGSYGGAYTTRPLAPANGSVLDFSQSFLIDVFNFNFGIYLNSNTFSDIYLLFGPTSTASIYKFLYLQIDNNTIWSTTYNRTEARIASLALPSSEVNYSQEYASIDKLLDSKHSPMKIIKIPKTTLNYTAGSDDNYKEYVYNLRFDLTVDLNNLCVPFSNIDYICYNYGALSIKTDYTDIHQAMHYFVLPTTTSLNYGTDPKEGSTTEGPGGTIIGCQNGNSILTLNPVQWLMNSPVKSKGTVNYLDMGDKAQWIPIAVPINVKTTTTKTNNPQAPQPVWDYYITLSATTGLADTEQSLLITDNTLTKKSLDGADSFKDIKYLSIPIAFCLNPKNRGNYCFELLESQIAQITFDIEDESKAALAEYFASIGKVILPIQVFSTSELNNGTVGPTSGSSIYPAANIIADISGNNFSNIIVTLAPNESPCCFVNPYVQDYMVFINGENINKVPYAKVNNRVIKDYTNACVDTDTEEINTDYLYSLQFPPEVIGINDGSNTKEGFTAPNQYFIDGDFKNMKTLNWNSSMTKYIKNPNGFMHVLQLEIPESYHTGYSVIELQPLKSSFRLTGSYYNTYQQMIDKSNYRFVNDHEQHYVTSTEERNVLYSQNNLTIPSYVNRDCTFRVTALCDAVIYLDYDSGLNTCTGGALSYSAPYVTIQ